MSNGTDEHLTESRWNHTLPEFTPASPSFPCTGSFTHSAYAGKRTDFYCLNCNAPKFQVYVYVQPCPTLCDPMDCSPPGSSVHRDSPGKNTGVGCHALLQGIFLTQKLNLSLLQCRWIFYLLSRLWKASPSTYKGKPLCVCVCVCVYVRACVRVYIYGKNCNFKVETVLKSKLVKA